MKDTMRQRSPVLRWAAVVLAVPVAMSLASGSVSAHHGAGAAGVELGDAWVSPSAVEARSPLGGAFSPASVWEQHVVSAPVAPDSAEIVDHLAQQVSSRYGGVAAFNVWQYNTTVYTVPRNQPTVDVVWDNCQDKSYTPRGLLGPGGQFTAVPIPPGAVPSNGLDGQLTIYSPSTDQLWEFWKAERVDGVWQACWGGRIDEVSSSPGYFLDGFGGSATGLAISAGSITVAEAEQGRIDHAMALAIPEPSGWQNFSWPAQRSDGSSSSTSPVMEGQRFRLDPSIDVTTLGLTPIATTIARAAQEYGFIVVDKAGAVVVSAENAAGQVAQSGEPDPWIALMEGVPAYSIMAGFPWDRLQALPVDYGRP